MSDPRVKVTDALLNLCIYLTAGSSYSLYLPACGCVDAKLLGCVQLFATLWGVAPLSMDFSRQEYWSRLLCPPQGNLPNPGIEPASLTSPALAGGFFTTSTTWEAPDSTITEQDRALSMLLHRRKKAKKKYFDNTFYLHLKLIQIIVLRPVSN